MLRNRVPLFTLAVLGAGMCMAVLPCAAFTQDTSASKPATVETMPALAQTPPAASSAPSAAQAPAMVKAAVPAAQTPEKKKSKKVWTNDDVNSVHGGVSVVGDGAQGSDRDQHRDAGVNSDSQHLHRQQLDDVRKQIQQLRAQIAAIEKRMAQLKDFKAEDSSASGGIDLHQRYDMVPLEEQVKQLENKKKELQAKIEDVENEARKSGIEPGELR